MQELLDEIVAAVRPDHADRTPRRRRSARPRSRSTAPAPTSGLRFAGIPMGHEFTSLVLALLQVGGHPPKVDAGRDRADPARSTATSTFETYFSLSCQNCPDVVQALNLMAVLNPQHHATSPSTARCSRTRSTSARSWPCRPSSSTASVFGQGRMSLEEIVAKLDTGAARARGREDRRQGRRSTCWSSAAARPARRRRSTPRARASAPASPPSASAARCSTRMAHRELHLGARHRRPEARRRARAARARVRRRHHEPAARREAGAGDDRRPDRGRAGERRVAEGARP